MGTYIPAADFEQQEMLKQAGFSSFDDLYSAVPSGMRLKKLDIPDGLSELETSHFLRDMASHNKVYSSIFRGAGAYWHYIPSIVKSVVSKEEFVTAYTPYQAEVSQGILQSIFEYQTMICELTGMDLSNASVYDGAVAAAEAAAMCREKKRTVTIVLGAVAADSLQTIRTYCAGAGAECIHIPSKDGTADRELLEKHLSEAVASVYLEQPNFYGTIVDAEAIGALAHKAGAKFIMRINPVAGALLKTPRECNADIAVGEGQPLGMPLSFGGPYLGFMACTSEMTRRLPGRVVGETKDKEGNRAFVLTLQAREQHIRREKAYSNICSNQAHCALTANAYLTAVGKEGLKQVASLCYSKAHYLQSELCRIPGISLAYRQEFFHEFVTHIPCRAATLLDALEERDILGGFPIVMPDGKDAILWCATEMNTKVQMDLLVKTVKEACAACV